MFVLLLAAELYGRKHNIEVGFSKCPALDELGGHAEAVFRGEAKRLRPAAASSGATPQRHSSSNLLQRSSSMSTPKAATHKFVLDNIKIFDDTLNRWLDLTEGSQLKPWAQLYLVQPEGVESSNQQIFDVPIRLRSPLDAGSDKEKFFFLFHDMDFDGNGLLTREEVQRIFNVFCLYDYDERSVDEMFHTHDTNRDGVLSFAEFSRWMSTMPAVAEALLGASTNYWDACQRRPVEFRDSGHLSEEERVAIEDFMQRSSTNTNHQHHHTTGGAGTKTPQKNASSRRSPAASPYGSRSNLLQ